MLRKDRIVVSNLLLLHEFGIGAIVHDILAEDRSSENRVNLLGRDILELSVEDEVVSSGANSDSGFLSKEDKGEDITMLAHSQRLVMQVFWRLVRPRFVPNPGFLGLLNVPWRGSP